MGSLPRQKKLQNVRDHVEGVLEFVARFKVEFKSRCIEKQILRGGAHQGKEKCCPKGDRRT